MVKTSFPTPSTTETRVKASPSRQLLHDLIVGGLGFAAVSLAAFAVWAFGGRWFESHGGEATMYAACTVVFFGASGLLLHPLVRGSAKLWRFYRIFIPAYCVYALVWCGAWFTFHFGFGEWLGSLLGSLSLAYLIAWGVGSYRAFPKVSLVLFLTHSAGYFLGGMLMGWMLQHGNGGGGFGHHSPLPKLAWGLLYGLGLGAGLGYAFYTFQSASPQLPIGDS